MTRYLIAILFSFGFASAVQAVDTTGTWTGRERCDCFNDEVGKFREYYSDQVLKMSQDGTDLNIEAYGELFNGNMMNDPRNESRGEASLIACESDPTNNASFGEMGRAKVSVKSRGRGKMVIESLWNAQENQICQCKARFKRTDTEDPGVPDCAEGNDEDRWHVGVLKQQAPEVGCHELEYPSEEWVEVACGKPIADPLQVTHEPLLRGHVRAVGNGDDWVVNVNNGRLGQVTGSFEDISGVTSVVNSNNQRDNDYTLQLNSNFFSSPECPQSMPSCQGWQQAVYAANGTDPGYLIIQYWLINYNSDGTTCPSGWINFQNSCYVNASQQPSVDPVNTADLSEMKLTMTATAGGNDQVILRIGNRLHSATVTSPDNMVSLSQGWTQAEFNIFGNCCGYEAEFNSGSSMEVKLEISQYSGGTLSCQKAGYTGETNSLNLLDDCQQVPHQSPPAFTFTQNNE